MNEMKMGFMVNVYTRDYTRDYDITLEFMKNLLVTVRDGNGVVISEFNVSIDNSFVLIEHVKSNQLESDLFYLVSGQVLIYLTQVFRKVKSDLLSSLKESGGFVGTNLIDGGILESVKRFRMADNKEIEGMYWYVARVIECEIPQFMKNPVRIID